MGVSKMHSTYSILFKPLLGVTHLKLMAGLVPAPLDTAPCDS